MGNNICDQILDGILKYPKIYNYNYYAISPMNIPSKPGNLFWIAGHLFAILEKQMKLTQADITLGK